MEARTPIANDEIRLDGLQDTTSVSIGFPNDLMLGKYRAQCDKNGQPHAYAILLLSPDILWRKECIFCATNAASNVEKSKPFRAKSSADAFKSMYAESVQSAKTKIIRPDYLNESDPTDVQAEVMVFDVIDNYDISRLLKYFKPPSHFG